MKAALVIILAALACLFLILAALASGGVITVADGGWLLPAGLATLAVSWFVYLLPIP